MEKLPFQRGLQARYDQVQAGLLVRSADPVLLGKPTLDPILRTWPPFLQDPLQKFERLQAYHLQRFTILSIKSRSPVALTYRRTRLYSV